FRLEAVAQLARHGDGKAIPGRQVGNERSQRARQNSTLLPQLEGLQPHRSAGVGRLEVGAADVEAEDVHGHHENLARARMAASGNTGQTSSASPNECVQGGGSRLNIPRNPISNATSASDGTTRTYQISGGQ